jgi:hypothetical protein
MIFECDNKFGKHTVWDEKNQTVLCEFECGKYETNDEYKIKMLKLNGYKEIYNTPEKVIISEKENEKLKIDITKLRRVKR